MWELTFASEPDVRCPGLFVGAKTWGLGRVGWRESARFCAATAARISGSGEIGIITLSRDDVFRDLRRLAEFTWEEWGFSDFEFFDWARMNENFAYV